MSSQQKLRNFATERPVAVLMTFTAAVVFGYFSLGRLPITLMPELTYPTLTVRTEYAGAAPEEVENDISRPIEEALGVIGGLKRTNSISRAGVSDVVLEFNWGTDMSEASQSTLEKLDLVQLPEESERPLILHFDPSLDPIMELSFSGKGSRFQGEQGLRRLRRIAELQVKRALEPVKGVAAVRIRGGLEEEIQIRIDEQKLKRSNISIASVINRLAQENINVAGGTVKEGRSEYMVRTLNEYENLDEIKETVLLRKEGRNLRIKDLAEVVLSHKEREIVTNTDGRESVQIDIYKEADANMVGLAARIKALIAGDQNKQRQAAKNDQHREIAGVGLATQLERDEDAHLVVVADRSTFIKSSIDEVRNTALIGGVLAIIILFLFLNNVRSTAIIAISIPMSLLITFAPLNLFGLSLNIMSLGGLALGIGMLVDSSIVVLESIFRCREDGDDSKTSAVRGTNEVRGAVFASTLTSIAVFFPMVFVEGIAGQAFGDLGLAVVVSLIAAFVVAIYFIPMLSSREGLQLKGFKATQYAWFRFHCITTMKTSITSMALWQKLILIVPLYFVLRFLIGLTLELLGKIILALFVLMVWLCMAFVVPSFAFVLRALFWLPARTTHLVVNKLTQIYPGMVRWTLTHPMPVLLLTAVCFGLTWQIGSSLENELLPEVHQGEFTFEVSLPVGTPLPETQAALALVEKSMLADMEDIRSVLVTFGYDITNTQRSDEGEHSAKFKILLKPSADQAATERKVTERLRAHFKDVPDIDVRVSRPVLFSEKTPVEVEIQGDDLPVLKKMAQQVGTLLAGLPELTDVEITLKSGAPEIQVVYNRNQMMQLGLNIGEVARSVRDKVKGNEATRFNMKDRRVPIMVQLEQDGRDRMEDIARITVNPGGEHPIPLHSIAELVIGEGPSEVRRVDGQRVALVNANISQGSLGSAVKAIERVLREDVKWAEGTSYVIAGQSEEWEHSKGSLLLAIALSLFLVYVIMAAQFESLIHPFIIMFTIPLAAFGTFLGLKLLGIPLSIVVFLGMIMLAGIVVNNAIVLVDYINTLRRRGMATQAAIIRAGEVRLRPILMTTATTILGLLPMALGLGDGAEIRTPMAVAVVFGLLTSTFLTLLLIPTIYYITNLIGERLFGASSVTELEAEHSQEVLT